MIKEDFLKQENKSNRFNRTQGTGKSTISNILKIILKRHELETVIFLSMILQNFKKKS